MNNSQLEKLLGQIRTNRWAEFRNGHRILIWIAVTAGVSIVLAFVAPFFGIIAFLGWVCALSLGLSAASHSRAVARECQFLQRSHGIATQSATYEDFCEEYLQSIAKFQLLRSKSHYYAIEKSGESERERHAAQNTFVLLSWSSEWKQQGEIVSYPSGNSDTANCVKIRIYPTNLVRVRLIETFASLKFNSRTKAAAEKHVSLFNDTFRQEFKKFGFVLRDASEPFWPDFADKALLSPYWSRDQSGSFALKYRREPQTLTKG